MLKQIQALLRSLDSKTVDYQLDKTIWKQIVELYEQCSAEHRDVLISGLSKRFTLSNTALNEIFVLFNAADADDFLLEQTLTIFHDTQILAEDEKIALFKKRAIRHLPELDSSVTDRHEWLELIRRFEKLSLKHLTRRFLLDELSDITKTDYNAYIAQFSRDQPPRRVKVLSPLDSAPQIRSFKRRERYKDGENELIFQSTAGNLYLHSPLRKTGARVAELEPATPEKGFTGLQRTPGGSKVRPYWGNSKGNFFKPLTPYGKKSESGMVEISKNKRRAEVLEQIPALRFERPGPITFVATLEKLRARSNVRRRVSQLQVTGARCHDIFKAEGSDELITISGHDYHWSHLIAYFLGGEQSKENLIPGTAASNYNTLELVEQPIARKLIQEGVESIEITVTPSYTGDSFIPDELIFSLKWGAGHFETIHINSRSYKRITGPMHKSIELLSSFDDEQDGNDQVELNGDLTEDSLAPLGGDYTSSVSPGADENDDLSVLDGGATLSCF
ncbi:hypothetical protein BN59_02336 [Legionella massiliensis]|uniref:Type VII secretion system protein EssD-like domain-containing protein n=1 Tax=Legionella massiliensis TaxID=1034943 RepID=A0A078L1X6_9GAMM|nr:DNA/RNA non-specific endonuclease [Legionella massiliensis]CDZ78039.1 hypothetical protein BN59_02336 [Legionella massiliensis]CEE13777.1 hypothetical protein BN1094_02336 [Legionella massiliensis]